MSRRRALVIFYGVATLIVVPCLVVIGLIVWVTW